MIKLLYIALGGAAGTLCRYMISVSLQRHESAFPWGTLAVNVLGCLAIGVGFGLIASNRWVGREEIRLMLLVGVLGGFTTFSTFGWETFRMINQGQYTQAAVNILISNAAGIAAVLVGCRLACRGPLPA